MLTQEVHRLHVGAHPEFFRDSTDDDLRESHEQFLAKDSMATLVACDGDAVVAYVVLAVHERAANACSLPQRSLHVDQIGVTASHRGRGVGRLLTDAAKDLAREKGLSRLDLTVWAFNRTAREFFRSQGFGESRLQMALEL